MFEGKGETGVGKRQSPMVTCCWPLASGGLRSEAPLLGAQRQRSISLAGALGPPIPVAPGPAPARRRRSPGQQPRGQARSRGRGAGGSPGCPAPEGFTYCAEEGKEGETKRNGENNNRT